MKVEICHTETLVKTLNKSPNHEHTEQSNTFRMMSLAKLTTPFEI